MTAGLLVVTMAIFTAGVVLGVFIFMRYRKQKNLPTNIPGDMVSAYVPTADTGFIMSTNTVHSTISTGKNVAYGTNIGLNDVSV